MSTIDQDSLHGYRIGESKTRRVIAGILTVVPILFLLFDGVTKVMKITAVTAAMTQLGYPGALSRGIGVLLLICVAIYAIPRTAVLGAVLLTGYLGGAVSAQLRVGNPLFAFTFFPVYIALMLWGGLYLRDAQVRALLPLRNGR